MDVDILPKGEELSADELRGLADNVKTDVEGGEPKDPAYMTATAVVAAIILYEALAATKDELATLRQEFDAFKSGRKL